jgi:hypothetical protein
MGLGWARSAYAEGSPSPRHATSRGSGYHALWGQVARQHVANLTDLTQSVTRPDAFVAVGS